MDKIELRIMGGLGNQLYQYSSARYIQKKYNVKEMIIDCGEYDTYKIRNLEINQILHNDSVHIDNIKSLKSFIFRETYHIYQKVYRTITKNRPKQIITFGKKNRYLNAYIESNLNINLECRTLHMYGYFVSAINAMSIRDELMNEIWLSDDKTSNKYLEYLEIITSSPSIAVSVRVADDYVNNSWPICSQKFYCSGIDYILNKKYLNTDTNIFVFADDINKIKKQEWFSKYDNVIYIQNISVCECFELMRKCSDYVCSNSSFSWWGAFLSYTQNPIRINPNKVYSGNSMDVDQCTFYDGLTFLDYKTGEIII